jgi:hypothetical protein
MPKLLNLDAETGANIVDDGAEPTLTITNSSGAGLEVNKLVVTSGATIAVSKLSVNTPILAGNASITGFDVRGASVASGAVLSLSGTAFVSCSTINFTTAAVAGLGAVRVVRSDGTFGWIPVMPDDAVTAAAV